MIIVIQSLRNSLQNKILVEIVYYLTSEINSV